MSSTYVVTSRMLIARGPRAMKHIFRRSCKDMHKKSGRIQALCISVRGHLRL